MKTTFFLTIFALMTITATAQSKATADLDEDDFEAPYYMFQGGVGGTYNNMINKYGVNSRFYFHLNNKLFIGPEFSYFMPNGQTKNEYFFEFNVTRNIVPVSKVAFFGLIGATWRFGDVQPVINNNKAFQGINLGFGMSYRKDRWSYYITEKITSNNANLWLNAGVSYYFDIPALSRLTNIYSLKKRTRKE